MDQKIHTLIVNLSQGSRKEGLIALEEWLVTHPRDANLSQSMSPLERAILHEETEAMDMLLKHGASPHGDTTRFMKTPLHTAASVNNVAAMRKLLDAGADINGQDAEKWTALHFAVNRRAFEAVKLLVEEGIDASLKNEEDEDALTMLKDHAVRSNKEVIIQYLEEVLPVREEKNLLMTAIVMPKTELNHENKASENDQLKDSSAEEVKKSPSMRRL